MAVEVQLRRYCVSSKKGEGWGVFVIGSYGFFSVVSDYGNYAFWWTHFGEGDFRAFLISLEWDYAAGKLGQGHTKVFQGQSTIENVRDHILQHRRDGSWSKERALEEWELIESTDLSIHPEDWMRATKIEDAYELIRRDWPADVLAFCKVLLPRFQQVLRDELARETAPAAKAVG